MSSMDGASLFQQQTPSAASDMSGLVALMAVIDALSANNSLIPHLSTWPTHQVVFAAFDAESFGYLGSKQFIRELLSNQSSLKVDSLAFSFHVLLLSLEHVIGQNKSHY
jgi:Zn-dependent M28 family amino/carboxypeptidase